MKQKIVIRVSMPCDRCKTKVLEVAAKADGLISVSLTGDDREKLEVVGDGMDSVRLVTCLRKKVGYAEILRVEEVKDEKAGANKKPESKKEQAHPPPQYCPGYGYCPPAPAPLMMVCECQEPNNCAIM